MSVQQQGGNPGRFILIGGRCFCAKSGMDWHTQEARHTQTETLLLVFLCHACRRRMLVGVLYVCLDGEGAQGRADREPRVLHHGGHRPARREARADTEPLGELAVLS